MSLLKSPDSLPQTWEEGFEQVCQIIKAITIFNNKNASIYFSTVCHQVYCIALVINNDCTHNVQVCRERVAFLANAVLKSAVKMALPCEITSIDTGRIINLALIMPQGSEYLNVVNYM